MDLSLLRRRAVAATLSSGLLLAGAAHAHAHLLRATPAADSVVPTATQVDAWFSEALEGRFSTLSVTGPDGKAITKAAAHLDPKNAKHLIVEIDAKAPGAYTVAWAVTSVDTHKSSGTFAFTVKP